MSELDESKWHMFWTNFVLYLIPRLHVAGEVCVECCIIKLLYSDLCELSCTHAQKNVGIHNCKTAQHWMRSFMLELAGCTSNTAHGITSRPLHARAGIANLAVI